MQAVERRLRSDVPVVSYISGGLDSTVVLGCCSRQRGEPIPSFTIGFDRAGPDERSHATEAAPVLGSPLTTVTMDRRRPGSRLSRADPGRRGAGARHLVRGAVAAGAVGHQQGYKVALTGEGADEALAGYVWYKAQAIRDAVTGRIGHAGPKLLATAGHAAPWPAAGRSCRPIGPSAASARRSRSCTSSSRRRSRRSTRRHVGPARRPRPLRRPGHHERTDRPLASAEPVAVRRLQGDAGGPADDRQGRPDRDERLGRDALPVPRRRRDRVLLRDRPGVQAAGAGRRSGSSARRRPGSCPSGSPAGPRRCSAPCMSGTFLGPARPSWVDQLLSRESLEATGYFDPNAVARQRGWQTRIPRITPARFVFDVALTCVVSTQLWHHLFCGGGLCDLPTWQPTTTPAAGIPAASARRRSREDAGPSGDLGRSEAGVGRGRLHMGDRRPVTDELGSGALRCPSARSQPGEPSWHWSATSRTEDAAGRSRRSSRGWRRRSVPCRTSSAPWPTTRRCSKPSSALNATLAKTQLDGKLRELAYIKTSELNGCDYCLHHHRALGKKAGLNDRQVAETAACGDQRRLR